MAVLIEDEENPCTVYDVISKAFKEIVKSLKLSPEHILTLNEANWIKQFILQNLSEFREYHAVYKTKGLPNLVDEITSITYASLTITQNDSGEINLHTTYSGD